MLQRHLRSCIVSTKLTSGKTRVIEECWIRSAIQAMFFQLYRLHFGNPEINLTGFTIGVFISISIGYFP